MNSPRKEHNMDTTNIWRNTRPSPTSSSQQLSHPITWVKPPTSMYENGTEVFHFTHQPNQMWNTSSTDFLQDDTDSQQSEEVIDDTFTGKNYDVFETKLRDGFLEATGLGLVCAPPAMFDYEPPLQRIDLKDNKIELLPDHFFDELPMLRWCDLRYNRLQNLPPINGKHESLNVLLLQDNQLSELPCSLSYAVNLHTLGWTNNCISNPPRHVLLAGCARILKYLRKELMEKLPFDEQGNPVELPTDAQLKEDLEKMNKTMQAKRSTSRCSITSGQSNKSSVDVEKEKLKRQKRIDRIKYTWGLWKDVPYHGVSSQTLFENSLQEVKDELNAQMNEKKNSILKKIKHNEAMAEWRKETRLLQMQATLKPYTGVDAPFGTDKDVANDDRPQGDGDKVMDPETFRSTLTECMKKLQSFATNPTPLNDTEKSLQRLKEVEEIQQKILGMKMTHSVKSSNLV